MRSIPFVVAIAVLPAVGCSRSSEGTPPVTATIDPTGALITRRAPRCTASDRTEYNDFLTHELFPWFDKNASEAHRIADELRANDKLSLQAGLRRNLLSGRALLHVATEFHSAATECPVSDMIPPIALAMKFLVFDESNALRKRAKEPVRACLEAASRGSSEANECSRLASELESLAVAEAKLNGNQRLSCGPGFVLCRPVPVVLSATLKVGSAPRCTDRAPIAKGYYHRQQLLPWFHQRTGELWEERSTESAGCNLQLAEDLAFAVDELFAGSRECDPEAYATSLSELALSALLLTRSAGVRDAIQGIVEGCTTDPATQPSLLAQRSALNARLEVWSREEARVLRTLNETFEREDTELDVDYSGEH